MSFSELLRVAERGTASRAPLPEGMSPDLPFKEPPQAIIAKPAGRKARKSRGKYGPRSGSAACRAQDYCQEPRTVREIRINVPGISRTGIANLVGRGLLVNLRGPRKTAVYVVTEMAHLYREAYADAPVPPRKAPPRRQVRGSITWHLMAVLKPDMPKADKNVLIEVENPDGDPVWPGFHDGECWRYAEGAPVGRKVLAWADMPRGSCGGLQCSN